MHEVVIGFQRTPQMMRAARDALAAIVNYPSTTTVDRPPCATPSKRVPCPFSADEGADVSEDGETPVAETSGIAAPYRFTGSIGRVPIDLAPFSAADLKQEEEATAAIAREKALADKVLHPASRWLKGYGVRDRQLSLVPMAAPG